MINPSRYSNACAFDGLRHVELSKARSISSIPSAYSLSLGRVDGL